jgi:hypothetical protein
MIPADYNDEVFTGDPVFCPRHGQVIRSADGLSDGLCGGCEREMDEAFYTGPNGPGADDSEDGVDGPRGPGSRWQ